MIGIYKKLRTKRIPIHNSIHVTEAIIVEALESCYAHTAFSTFPYYFENLDSEQAIKQTNSGNCVALSMYMRNYLKDKYDINSCLIPATIPDKYSKPEYLTISHVALAVPISGGKYFIADPAFYFLNPILVNTDISSSNIVFSKNIYTPESSSDLKKYFSLDVVITKTQFTPADIKLNKWQTIPANIFLSTCYTKGEDNDTWHYFLCEIVNPDEAITEYFLKFQEPFITSTEGDDNKIPQMNFYLKIKDGKISYSKNLENKEVCDVTTISQQEIDKINTDLSVFFRGKFKDYLANLN